MMWQSSSRHLSSEKNYKKDENTTYATKLDQKHNM